MNEKTREQHEQTQRHKVNFRQPTQIIVTPGASIAQKSPSPLTTTTKQLQEQRHKANTTTQEEEDKLLPTTQREEEEEKMYFYYPKYLHPEAVALIAENLLHEWEQEEQNKSSNRVIDKS